MTKKSNDELSWQFIYRLLDRYFANKANDKEREVIETWDIKSELKTHISEKEINSARINTYYQLSKELGFKNKKQKIISLKTLSIAASLFILISLGISYLYNSADHQPFSQFYSDDRIIIENTDNGIKQVILPDGTQIRLNRRTQISYLKHTFNKKQREIWLHGEAFLNVAKNKHKPFIIQTNDIEIKVLGTTFNVRAYDVDKTTQTTLIEGSVNLTTKTDHPETVLLSPKDKVIVDRKSGLSHKEQTDLYAETAWLHDEIVFKSATFDEIINELELYYNIEINVSGHYKGQSTFSGSFHENKLNPILQILQQHFKFRYVDNQKLIQIIFDTETEQSFKIKN